MSRSASIAAAMSILLTIGSLASLGWDAQLRPDGLVGDAIAQSSDAGAVPATFTEDPLGYYFDEKYAEALRYGNATLADPALRPEVQRNVLVTLGTIHLARGKQLQARESFMRILAADPVADLSEPERLPLPVKRMFYRLRDSICTAQLDQLVAARKLGMDIKTIAVGDIENNSLVKTSFDLDHLCRGLAQVIQTDLRQATSLKLVDRQRLSTLLDEIGMSKDPQQMDPQSRVRLGQLSGAQSYLFGQYMQLDRTNVRMDLRWVNTATGEIMLSEGIQARVATADDLFKLERRILVELLAPQIQRMLDSTRAPTELQRRIEKIMDDRKRAVPRNMYAVWIESSGAALANEESGNEVAAASAWEKASRLNPADATARARARTLSAYRKAKG